MISPQPTTTPPREHTSSAGQAEMPASNSPASAPALAEADPSRVDMLSELAHMRETLAIVSSQIKEGIQAIAAGQQKLGWPDLRHVENETSHLLRQAMDLHNNLMEYQIWIGMKSLKTQRALKREHILKGGE